MQDRSTNTKHDPIEARGDYMITKKAALFAGLGLTLMLSACGGSSSSESSEAPAASDAPAASEAPAASDAPAAGEVTIAVAGPITGDNAVYGLQQLAGIELFAEQINAAGGIADGPLKGSMVKVVSFDDAADPNQGAAVAQQICDDDSILATFGHSNSSVTLAAMPIYERCGMPLFVSYSSNPKITEELHEYLFRSIVADDAMGAEMAFMAKNDLSGTSAGVLASPDDYGNGLVEAFEPAAEQAGLNIAGVISTSPDQKDFTPQLTELQNAGADVLVLLNTYSDAGLQIKQARALGWDVPILTTAGANNPELINIAGAENAEGVFIAALYDGTSTDAGTVKFREDFAAANDGEEPSEGAAMAFNTAPLLFDALAAGAGDRASVIATVPQIGTFQLPITGEYVLSDTHSPTLDPTQTQQKLLQVKGGQIVSAG